jgi:hypothetical protein
VCRTAQLVARVHVVVCRPSGSPARQAVSVGLVARTSQIGAVGNASHPHCSRIAHGTPGQVDASIAASIGRASTVAASSPLHPATSKADPISAGMRRGCMDAQCS